MPEDTFLMGLKMTKLDKGVVYIVTIEAVGDNVVHPGMPLVVGADKQPVEFEVGGNEELGFEQQKLF